MQADGDAVISALCAAHDTAVAHAQWPALYPADVAADAQPQLDVADDGADFHSPDRAALLLSLVRPLSPHAQPVGQSHECAHSLADTHPDLYRRGPDAQPVQEPHSVAAQGADAVSDGNSLLAHVCAHGPALERTHSVSHASAHLRARQAHAQSQREPLVCAHRVTNFGAHVHDCSDCYGDCLCH